MKKIIFLIIFLTGCISYVIPPSFDHVVVKKSIKRNPSFTVVVFGYNSNWLAKEIEDALLFNKVTVLALPPRQIITTTTGDVKNASSKNEQDSVSKSQVDVTSSTGLFSQTKADYVIQADYDNSSFKIILVKTQEIIATGTFSHFTSRDIKSNITTILGEMEIIN